MLFVCYLFVLYFVEVRPELGLITLVAGIGTSSYSGNGGLPTSAGLNQPHAIYISSDQFYFTEWANNVVRLIDLTSNTISTFAGTGASGYNGDFFRTSALLKGPVDMRIADGYMYICDVNRIRRISMSTGTIETYAGTGTSGYSAGGIQATSAPLDTAFGMYIDASYVWACDNYYSIVYRIDRQTTIISRYAGNGTSGFTGDGGLASFAVLNTPTYVFVDASKVWISDRTNNRIRVVSRSTNTITTFAGTGTATYGGDGGNCATASINKAEFITVTNYLWISDRFNYRIRRVDLLTNIITTIVGTGVNTYSGDGGYATAATINEPFGMFMTKEYLYFSDLKNNRIRRVVSYRPGLFGDPHFVGLSGGSYTIDLLPERCYKIFSSSLLNWNSCTVQPGHRSSTYLGNTTLIFEGYNVLIPLLKIPSVIAVVNGKHYVTVGKQIKLGKHASFRIYRRSIVFKTPCLNILFYLKCQQIVSKNVKSTYRSKYNNHFDAFITRYLFNNTGCSNANGLIGITWNKTARSTGRHGEGIIDGDISKYIVQSIWDN